MDMYMLAPVEPEGLLLLFDQLFQPPVLGQMKSVVHRNFYQFAVNIEICSMRRIIITEDGSHSVTGEGGGENYHSIHGAITESIHVYIRGGLRTWAREARRAGLIGEVGGVGLSREARREGGTVHVFEMGLGTGLNVFLTLVEASALSLRVHYEAIEAYPLEEEITRQLNYPSLLDLPEARMIFERIHAAPWGQAANITPDLSLLKRRERLEDLVHADAPIDVLYFDAFAPDLQPELWTPSIFEKLFARMAPGGMLTTYCSKGKVRRCLQDAGFIVEKIAGPPGKREMIRAVKLRDH
jgi:tRNA U34 5-methylaminomethyl-2-thiouridine-forming methyltransferase MnmC